ncbi:hypothetical protein PoB_004096600 [Plakobranchus ocellatus]|uniref:Uncharacterized protein n=1 Tax=Plakobranchus ocellatus TaxID=259542 RepID=A0AAV4B6M8_9GAST|nr:hypothetical protein PoB_004096600 [Plakobranchus ocellatus]
MEVEASRVLWVQSLERKLRYTTIISDGDSKTYNEIIKLNPYPGTEVVKIINLFQVPIVFCLDQLIETMANRPRRLTSEEAQQNILKWIRSCRFNSSSSESGSDEIDQSGDDSLDIGERIVTAIDLGLKGRPNQQARERDQLEKPRSLDLTHS